MCEFYTRFKETFNPLVLKKKKRHLETIFAHYISIAVVKSRCGFESLQQTSDQKKKKIQLF